MSKKLLLAAVLTFLSMAVFVAFNSDGSLAGAQPYHLGNVVIYSVVTFPLAAAIVVWEHRSSRVIKLWSTGAGLVITLTVVWSMGPVPSISSELKTSAEVFYRSIIILSCFILTSTLISVACRILIRLWALVCHFSLKLKNFSGALPNERRNV